MFQYIPPKTGPLDIKYPKDLISYYLLEMGTSIASFSTPITFIPSTNNKTGIRKIRFMLVD